jgi:hypothetical protein
MGYLPGDKVRIRVRKPRPTRRPADHLPLKPSIRPW